MLCSFYWESASIHHDTSTQDHEKLNHKYFIPCDQKKNSNSQLRCSIGPLVARWEKTWEQKHRSTQRSTLEVDWKCTANQYHLEKKYVNNHLNTFSDLRNSADIQATQNKVQPWYITCNVLDHLDRDGADHIPGTWRWKYTGRHLHRSLPNYSHNFYFSNALLCLSHFDSMSLSHRSNTEIRTSHMLSPLVSLTRSTPLSARTIVDTLDSSETA